MPRRLLPRRILAAIAFLAAPLATAGRCAADTPAVVASIAPLHSLVAGVMAGVGAPALLIRPGASPHAYAFKPSEARALRHAKVVFWIGEGLETFLARPLRSLSGEAVVVEMTRVPGVVLHRARAGGIWEGRADDRDHDHEGHNPHLWLDPVNAKAWVEAIARELTAADPANGAAYAANARAMRQRLDALIEELEAVLAPVRQRPYVVFHDAYHYFEARFRLNAVGSVAVSPDRPPGARRLIEIRDGLRARQAACLFAEPQFPPRLARTAIEGTGARLGTLDPLGAAIPNGPEMYFQLLRSLAADLGACLGGSTSR